MKGRRLSAQMSLKGEKPEAVVHIGTNDRGRNGCGGGEALHREYRSSGKRLKSRTSKVTSGLLLVPVLVRAGIG